MEGKKDQQKNNKRKKIEQPEEEDSLDDDQMEIENINITKLQKELKDTDQNQNSDEDGQMEEDYENVDVDFIFVDPDQKQFHSIKNLLNGYLDGVSFRSSELADIVVNQKVLGTMIGLEDNEEETKQDFSVLGFCTILNLNNYKGQKVIDEIVKFLMEKSQQNNNNHKDFIEILLKKKVGLLLNERILNLAPQVVPTLHEQVIEDLKWLRKENHEDAPMFDLDYLVILSKMFKEQQKKQKNKKNTNEDDELIYQKFEDFRFFNKSVNNFRFEAQSTKSQTGITNLEKDYKDQQICYRTVTVIKFNEYLNVVPQIQQDLIEQYMGIKK